MSGRVVSTVAALVAVGLGLLAARPRPAPTPPVAEVRPYEVVSPHGTRIDPYHWLRDDTRSREDVLGYLTGGERVLRGDDRAPPRSGAEAVPGDGRPPCPRSTGASPTATAVISITSATRRSGSTRSTRAGRSRRSARRCSSTPTGKRGESLLLARGVGGERERGPPRLPRGHRRTLPVHAPLPRHRHGEGLPRAHPRASRPKWPGPTTTAPPTTSRTIPSRSSPRASRSTSWAPIPPRTPSSTRRRTRATTCTWQKSGDHRYVLIKLESTVASEWWAIDADSTVACVSVASPRGSVTSSTTPTTWAAAG